MYTHLKQRYQTDKELERSVRDLSEQLSSLLCDCNAKDDLVAIHSKMAEEAIAGYLFPYPCLIVSVSLLYRLIYQVPAN